MPSEQLNRKCEFLSNCRALCHARTTPGRTDGDGRRASFKPCLSIHIVHAYIHVHAHVPYVMCMCMCMCMCMGELIVIVHR